MRTNVLITAPFKSISGYGLKSLDLVESIIELKPEWNIQLIKTKWGNNPDREYTKLDKYIVENITHAPDVYIHIGMPDEMKNYGTEKNILFTSSTEVTLVPSEWIDKVNSIDLTIVPSTFNKQVFESTVFTDAQQKELKVNKPIEILFEGYNEKIFDNKVTSNFDLSIVKEQFAFLSVGQYTGCQVFGQDRKNIGNLIRVFYETFKNKPNQPALILKSNMGNHSKVDKFNYEELITNIQKTFNSKNLPNVYLLHGELSDEQMNQLYNHPKVKAMVSLTRGESVGRPLLEFAITGKPIIVPKHSGYLDFLDEKYYTLVSGSLQQIHPTTAWKAMIPESNWFEPNYGEFSFKLNDMFKNYKIYLKESKTGGDIVKRNFSKEKMKLKLNQIFKDYVPEKVELKIPDFLRNK